MIPDRAGWAINIKIGAGVTCNKKQIMNPEQEPKIESQKENIVDVDKIKALLNKALQLVEEGKESSEEMTELRRQMDEELDKLLK